MSSLDYLDLCRLCLVKDRVSVPIFEGEGDVRQIFLKIAACLPVKVAREDKLPKKICDDCVYKVELLYQFWNTTASAEKQLLQWLGDVSLDDKQGYVTGAHNQSLMKPGQNPVENRLDGSVMQQVNDHPNNMGMGMMDSMGMGMPMMITTSGQQQQSQQQQQMTSVPMDTGGNTVQNVQAVPGPSTQSTHEQIAQQKVINQSSNPEDDEDESEEDDNSDDECDGDDGLPVKEESEEDPNSSRTIEPTTFVNVSLACDEAGPSGLQQQKIGEMPEMVMPTTDGDPKSGYIAPDPLGPDFLTVKIMDDFFRIPKSLCYFIMRHPPVERNVPTDIVTKDKVKDDEKHEEEEKSSSPSSKSSKSKSKKISPSSPVQKPEEIPTIKIECPSADETTAASPTPPPPRKRRRKTTQKPQKTKKKPTRSKKIPEVKSDSLPEEIPTAELADAPASSEEKSPVRAKRPKKKSEPVTYECEACSLSFSLRRNYRLHMIKHSTVRSHKCKICDKAFKRKSELNTHMQLHSGVKYTCDECDFVTTTKISVRIHVRRVHQRDFRYKCDECGKSFMSNCELKDHRTSHLGEKSFVCEFCGKAYLQKSYLVAHKRVVHGVIQKSIKKDHQCKICNKSFASEYILKNHGGVHTRKFLCTRCGKEFATNHGLLLHNRMHTGERPYQCTQCSKSFVRSNALAVHQLTHSGERPYVCDLCGKSFTQRTTMMVHRKKHPGSHPPPPPTMLKRLVNNIDSHS